MLYLCVCVLVWLSDCVVVCLCLFLSFFCCLLCVCVCACVCVKVLFRLVESDTQKGRHHIKSPCSTAQRLVGRATPDDLLPAISAEVTTMHQDPSGDLSGALGLEQTSTNTRFSYPKYYFVLNMNLHYINKSTRAKKNAKKQQQQQVIGIWVVQEPKYKRLIQARSLGNILLEWRPGSCFPQNASCSISFNPPSTNPRFSLMFDGFSGLFPGGSNNLRR